MGVTFRIPRKAGGELLLHRCAKCGGCCRSPFLRRILLTYADMVRLSEHLGYSSLDEFRKNECLKVEFKNYAGTQLSLPMKITTVSGWCLKRSKGEKPEDSANGNPLDCRFLTTNNVCTIYPVRPSPCRIWPYYVDTIKGEINAFYSPQHNVECQGFLQKGKVKRRLLAEPASEIRRHLSEVQETIEKGFYEEKTDEMLFDFSTAILQTAPSKRRDVTESEVV